MTSATMPTVVVSRRDWRGSVASGCMIALGVVAVLLVIVGVWVATSYRGWVGTMMRHVVTQVVEDSDLSAEQKAGIIAHVDRLADDFENKRITLEQFAGVLEKIAESRLIPVGILYAVEGRFVEPSDLSREEKDRVVLVTQRLARGYYEEDISDERLRQVMEPISVWDVDGDFWLKEEVATAELLEFASRAGAAADEAGVPDERHEIDIAQELGDLIDRALGRGGGG